MQQTRHHPPNEENTTGLFGKILEKLGIGDDDRAKTPKPAPPPASASTGGTGTRTRATAPAAAPPPAAMPMVDVVSQLEKRAAANPQKLNWRTSIVDLLSSPTVWPRGSSSSESRYAALVPL